ncbi:MAG: hypothetical protein AAF959_07630 [Cyanobacteria bacterium P01_D01_bin.56]
MEGWIILFYESEKSELNDFVGVSVNMSMLETKDINKADFHKDTDMESMRYMQGRIQTTWFKHDVRIVRAMRTLTIA